jgi:energy-coupling factor transporter ATP-binding protein EcfA2
MIESAQRETLVGRKEELQHVLAAIRKRNSLLIWGPTDVGKTSLIKAAIAALAEAERHTCIYWTGAASGKQLLSHFVGQLYELGDSFVRKKVHSDGGTAITLNRWLREQTSLRLRGILFTALEHSDYRFFVDHFPPPTHNMVRLMKEILYRCKTPIYLAARSHSQDEIGYAWSLYWNDKLRIHLGPLSERASRELLETCIGRFGLTSLDLADFREDVLRLSGHLPGGIVKMCELAGNSRYHYRDQIKIKLVHVDYLLQSNPSSNNRTPAFLQ